MTVYDLEKLATPGPVDGVRVTFYEVRLPSGTLTHLYPNEETSGYDKRFDAHCRNNFMKALKALHDLADTIQYQTSFENAAYKECIALIKGLEEVK